MNREGRSALRCTFPVHVLVAGLLVACSDGPESTDSSEAWFSDVAATSGVAFSHVSGAEGEFYLPEIMGSGVALFDVEQDGDLDVYLVQSGGPVDGVRADANELYRNTGNGTFELATNTGLESTAYGIGTTVGDYDNDGRVDVYVTNIGGNQLFRNSGDASFAEVSELANVANKGFSTAACFGDFDADGDLDLFVVNYVDWRIETERNCYDYGTGARNYCDPGNYDLPTSDVIYENNGDGTFNDISVASGIASSRGNGLGAVATDFDGDGDIDIFVANDKSPNHLWINQGDLTFVNEAFARGAAFDDHGIAKAGMGVVARDLDHDLDQDVIVVNIQGETDSYYRNDGAYFSDATAQVGLTRFSRNYTRFGIALVDFDHDGRLDFYEANGRVTFSPESATVDPYAEPNVLFRGASAYQFEFVDSTLVHAQRLIHTSRGVASGDLNGDGKIDLVVTNRDAPAYVLQNKTKDPGTWLAVLLENQYGSPDLHAQLHVETDLGEYREHVQVGGSYLAANSPVIHMTFPTAPVISSANVRWSDGAIQVVESLSFNAYNVIRRSQTATKEPY